MEDKNPMKTRCYRKGGVSESPTLSQIDPRSGLIILWSLVQAQHGLPKNRATMHVFAAVAQLDRVLGYEPRGRGFDSCQPHQMKSPQPQAAGFFLFRSEAFSPGRSFMSKAFTRETDSDADDELPEPVVLPTGVNYITRAGYDRLRTELMALIDDERPRIVEIVHWAASNGDRSENGDYLYGKKRLREIDRRIRFLTRRLEVAEVVDCSQHHGGDQVFFGATVTYADDEGRETTVTILGVDEADSSRGEISWVSPVARALLKARVGDLVRLVVPGGSQELEILSVSYPAPGG